MMGRWRWARWLPGVALGVFVARVLGQSAGLPNVAAAVALSAVLGSLGAWLLARWPLARTWPALLLLAYLVQLEPRYTVYTWPAAALAFVLNELAPRGGRYRWPAAVVVAGGLLFALFLALYVVTLAPDVLAADSGELQTVAAQLGVAHPPGFPLYVMIAHLFSRLPFASPAYAVNLFSAVTGALTVLVVYVTGWRLTRQLLPALLGAVALGTATTFWSQATTANVRSLTALLAAGIIWALVELRIATTTKRVEYGAYRNSHRATKLRIAEEGKQTAHDSSNSRDAIARPIRIAKGDRPSAANATTPSPPATHHLPPAPHPSSFGPHPSESPLATRHPDRWLILAAALMGLGLTHHPSLAFLILIGLLFIIWVDPALLRSPRRWVWPIAAASLGLLPLLYLPLRAGAAVRGASLQLATLPGFLEHALATGFRGDLFYYLAPADLAPRLLIMGNVMTFQFAPLVLLGMVIGLVWLLWRDRPLALLLGGSWAVYAVVAATYRAPQTVEYMMPAYVPAALLLAVGLARLPEWLGRFPRVARPAGVLLTALVAVAALGQFGHRSASGAAHEATSARDYAGRLLADAPPDSVLLAHWHWATPLWYLQEVEGARPDVDVRFVFPEGEPYDATWARRAAAASAEGRPVITTWVPVAPLADLPVPEPVGEALLYPQEPRATVPAGYVAEALTLGGVVEVVASQIEEPTSTWLIPGHEAVITIAWRAAGSVPPQTTLFMHLVGQDGTLYAQDDRPARAAEGITLSQFRLTPRPETPAGELTVFVGASSDGVRQPLTTLRINHDYITPLTRNPVDRKLFDSLGTKLIGYDWDHTLEGRRRLYLHWGSVLMEGYWTTVVDDAAIDALELPPYSGPWGVPVRTWRFPRGAAGGHYVPLGAGIVWTGGALDGLAAAPGESFTLAQTFHSRRPINRDYVVSVRLIGLEPDGFHWAWWDLQDSVPALGAIPTLKWVEGSVVRSPHRVTVAPDAPPGQALTGALTLYDSFTNRPLPILDERITAAQSWIPLGRAVVEE